jgi:hypothetical protein
MGLNPHATQTRNAPLLRLISKGCVNERICCRYIRWVTEVKQKQATTNLETYHKRNSNPSIKRIFELKERRSRPSQRLQSYRLNRAASKSQGRRPCICTSVTQYGGLQGNCGLLSCECDGTTVPTRSHCSSYTNGGIPMDALSHIVHSQTPVIQAIISDDSERR